MSAPKSTVREAMFHGGKALALLQDAGEELRWCSQQRSTAKVDICLADLTLLRHALRAALDELAVELAAEMTARGS
jgi:hypothetical protein